MTTSSTNKDKDAATAQRWIKRIKKVLQSKECKQFTKIGEKCVKIYKNHNYSSNTNLNPNRNTMFNVLWANIQVLQPTLYARMPRVVVTRRFKDNDPVGRLAATICERATQYMIDIQDDGFNYAVSSAVQDRLLPGRGMAWLRYDAEFDVIAQEPVEGSEDTDEAPQTNKTVKPNSERVNVDFVYWQDYVEGPGRTQYEITWKARRAWLSKNDFKERFGEELLKCCESTSTKELDDYGESTDPPDHVEVYEIWDKETKKVYFICLDYLDSCLDIKDDPLRLDGFFPCPKPLLATTATDSQWPVADFAIYEQLAEELDYVTKRISAMVECIRLVGVTASQYSVDIKNMMRLSDGNLWGMDNYAAFAERGGLKGAIDWLPFDACVAALEPLIGYQDKLLSQIWEITGIPDIARGNSAPEETAAAQQQKGQWLSLRISQKQQDVQRFCREIVGKISEIIFEEGLFSDDTIALMCGAMQMKPEDQQLWPQALQLLRDDRLSTFRVDVETDSTIAVDESTEKEERMEYVTALNNLFSNIQSVTAVRPELMSPMLESAMFAIRAFRSGRSVEGAWDRAIQQIEEADKAAAENPQPPPPDPATIQAEAYAADIQAKNQLKQLEMQNHFQELQATQQVEMQKLQFQAQELQQKAQEAQMRYDVDMRKIQIEGAKVMDRKEMDQLAAQMDVFRAQFQAQLESQRLEIEKYKTILSEEEKRMEEQRLAAEQRLELGKLAVDVSKTVGE